MILYFVLFWMCVNIDRRYVPVKGTIQWEWVLIDCSWMLVEQRQMIIAMVVLIHRVVFCNGI